MKRGVLHPEHLRMTWQQTISMQIGRDGPRYMTHLIGLSHDEYILVKLPVVAGININLMPGRRVIVRYVVSGNVYGFSCQLIGHHFKPYPLLFLTYPKEIEIHSLRSCERVDTFIETFVHFNQKTYSGAILDLSCGGCQLVLNRKDQFEKKIDLPKFDDEDQVFLSFQIGADYIEELVGRVIAMEVMKNKINLGLAFESGQNVLLNKIDCYINNVLGYLG
ncbi:flagellar brake protein [Desulfobacterales bacterium HSG17]|nr:flagellar brake protein [Desulfobacterales bacterium HSG17]